ncbi:class I SAM-dependent methyltransferase [Lysinimonas soli]|uniref:Class I SAM-dependent methyltransferase n=1 Tax=Lysinimonas soli TaxID=1074233 RepID=A0ABW0NKU3_9MICO
MSSSDPAFSGSIPELYERLMVPMLFEPYARDLARRAREVAPASVLELAAGTGVVTRQLAEVLSPDAAIVATDLSQAMLDEAASREIARPVEWVAADAMSLPFADASFDLVVCQFGVMFFPDKPTAFAEARRVLRPGGSLLFNVWDEVAANDFVAVVQAALAEFFPEDPPSFMAELPHGYHSADRIRRDLELGGFTRPVAIETRPDESRASSAEAAAIAYCQANPNRLQIERRGSLDAATRHVTAALTARFGSGPIKGRMQALVVSTTR